jgi:hypothetical protein
MDFNLSEEQLNFQRSVRNLAERHLKENILHVYLQKMD